MPTTETRPAEKKESPKSSMEKGDQKEPRVALQAMKLSARFAHVYPIITNNLLRQLLVNNLGYTWTAQDLPKGAIGIEAVHSGRVAAKDDLEVDYNADKQVLGIAGNNSSLVVTAFTELISTVQSAVQPTNLKVFFFEAIITALAEGNKSPLAVFSAESNRFKKMDEFDEIFQEPTSPLSLRICPPNRPLDNTDWFEYRIEPLNFQPERIYTISTIYRNKDQEKVVVAISNFEARTKKLILALEK